MSGVTLCIRKRVLLIALVPLLLITLLLGSYFIYTQLDDAKNHLLEKGDIISQMLATSAEFGLLTNNQEVLDSLIQATIQDNEIDAIVFLTPDFQELSRGGKSDAILAQGADYPVYTDKQVIFIEPVVATGIDFADESDNFITQEPDFIGWTAVILSLESTHMRQEGILLKGILIASTGLLITFILAYRFGQKISHPIIDLTQTVETLESGDFGARAKLSHTGEMHSLAQGINRLAQRVQESNFNLEVRVESATQRMRNALSDLEKKNIALDTSRRKADSANQAKDEFLARMSHELRTPLTSVSGFTRLLEQTALQPDQKEYTRIINLTSELLLSIIDDILDYSKLESNAVELEKIPFDLESCIMDVLEMQAATAHEKGIELIPLIPADTPNYLIGDPVRIRQILSNLVSNAVKFTSSGHVSVSVTSTEISPIECQLKIVVADTGTGIPASRIKHLFKAFSQADTSITRRFGGSGLGLVIAKRLTELMSGAINLTSQEGKGTQVTLDIPITSSARQKIIPHSHLGTVIVFDKLTLVRQSLSNQLRQSSDLLIHTDSLIELEALQPNHPDAAIILGFDNQHDDYEKVSIVNRLAANGDNKLLILSAKPLPIKPSARILQLRKPARTQLLFNALTPESYKLPTERQDQQLLLEGHARILVAEDNDFNRLLITRILEQAGSQVIPASTGEEALKLAIEQEPDIILMDVHMPVMDGIEATKQIRLTLADTPIIALTANVIDNEHQALLKAGTNQVLLKPIDDRKLCHSINHFLSQSENLKTLHDTADNQPLLEKYSIHQESLHQELGIQVERLFAGFKNQDFKLMRHHSHQLSGLAGLYELPELEAASANLHDALISESIRKIWKAVWQIQRLTKAPEQ